MPPPLERSSRQFALKTPGGESVQHPPARSGYWMVGSDGTVYPFGDGKSFGNAATSSAVDLEPTPSGNGYWIVDDIGRVFTLGDAGLHGVRAFGNATHLGDVSTVTLAGPVHSIVTPSNGEGLLHGGVRRGDLRLRGCRVLRLDGRQKLNAAVQSLVPGSDGVGYWLVASDGGIFAFSANFKGSMGATRLNRPVTGMVRAGGGYLMVGEDGGIFDFSGSRDGFKGSLGANPPAKPITAVAVLESR